MCRERAKPSKRAGIIYCHQEEAGHRLEIDEACLPFVTSSVISEKCLVQNAHKEKRAEM